MLRPEEKMNAQVNAPVEIIAAPERSAVGEVAPSFRSRSPKLCLRTLLAVPAGVLIALTVHVAISGKEPAPETHLYTIFLGSVLASAILAALVQGFWSGLRR